MNTVPGALLQEGTVISFTHAKINNIEVIDTDIRHTHLKVLSCISIELYVVQNLELKIGKKYNA